MRKTRRILSIILTIALMMTMVQPNIFATDTSETSAVRGKINMVYFRYNTIFKAYRPSTCGYIVTTKITGYKYMDC